MEQQCNQLLSIAQSLGLTSIEAEVASIISRQSQENPLLILPLVGEFSSGKTTLINALTDRQKLETGNYETTATIYEVHFGCDSCRATVLTEKGELVEYQDISNLKNESVANAKVITVFDTSTKVSPSIILVDTPGLSSKDPKHKQTLVNFLPKADGILLIVDINQLVTKSLTDFIEMTKLTQKPIFLILTQSDLKPDNDIELSRRYISENCQIPLKQVAVVSARKNRLDELYNLFEDIQKTKKEILSCVDKQRVKDIATRLSAHLDDLINSASSDSQIDESINNLQHELNRIRRKIDYLIDSVSDDILRQERETVRKFEDTVQGKLYALVAGSSTNFDAEAVSMINSTSSLLLSDYKNAVRQIISNAVKSQEDDIFADSVLLSDINLNDLNITGLSYNLDLNNLGHQYDEYIKIGVIAAVTIGAVAVAGDASTGMEMISAGDSLTSNTPDNDLVGALVRLGTEEFISKPQRTRAVRLFVDDSLSPEFRAVLKGVSERLISTIRDSISSSSAEIIQQKKDTLKQLKKEKQEKEELFKTRLLDLKEYKRILSTIN